MKKRSIFLLFLTVFVFGFILSGCKKEVQSELPVVEAEKPDVLMEIKTSSGVLMYPEKWGDSVKVKETQKGNNNNIEFVAEIKEKEYSLFKLIIGEMDAAIVGTLTDSEGNKNDVYVEITELGDVSKLSQEEQNTLYAMQEGINVVLNNLK